MPVVVVTERVDQVACRGRSCSLKTVTAKTRMPADVAGRGFVAASIHKAGRLGALQDVSGLEGTVDFEFNEPLPDGVEDLRPWFIAIHDLTETLDWGRFWGNDNPVQLDVGCGRGLFLFNASLRNPDTNYLGLELDFREGRRSARRLWKRQAANARVIGGDGTLVLRKYIEPHSVDAVHVYFPDPWWRRKHRRRRIFTDEFVGLCSRVLRPGGELHSWTDVPDYFDIIKALMDNHDDFETQPEPEERPPEHDMDYQTSFERKKRKEGFPIFRGLWKRRELETSA